MREPTTQLQASGQRFLARRLERALRCGTLRSVDDPRPGRSALTVGCVLAAVVLLGCVSLALIRPESLPGDAPIVLGRQSGALYVRVAGTLHPVLNLVSARLIADTAADPRLVRDSDLARLRRGPLLGIPGAPQVLGAALSGAVIWSVCDTPGATGPTTTVVVREGEPVPGVGIVDAGQPVLVTAEAEAAVYLLYRGRRAVVAGAGPKSAGPAPRPVSPVLLGAIPEAPPVIELPAGLNPAVSAPVGAAVLCANWAVRPDGDAEVALSFGAGLPLPVDADPVVLARADGSGPLLDSVYLPPGRSAYIRSTGISGRSGGERYLVTDTGVRYPVDDDAARSLGLPVTALPAPWPVLAALPTGPQLDRSPALVARDVIDGP